MVESVEKVLLQAVCKLKWHGKIVDIFLTINEIYLLVYFSRNTMRASGFLMRQRTITHNIDAAASSSGFEEITIPIANAAAGGCSKSSTVMQNEVRKIAIPQQMIVLV